MLTPAALRGQEAESLYTGWGAGFHIGVGGMVPTGSLADDLKGCAVFTGGFDLVYRRARLKIDVNYSQPGKVSVTPCVGVNFNRLRWDMNTIKWEKDDEGKERPQIENVTDVHENSTSWTASVDVDIALGGKFVDLGGKSHYISSVRITPFITHVGYSHLSPAVKGNWIGMTVSYSGLSRLLSKD